MRKIAVLFSLSLLFSCSLKLYPHKGSYPKPPFVYSSDKSFEKVWDNIIDFFAQKGISIELIDRSSGLIISRKTDMLWSAENRKTNKIIKPEAWVVIDNVFDPGPNKYRSPSRITGVWNIRVKPVNDTCTINVNLNDLQAYENDYTRSGTPFEVPTKAYNPQTTGEFEKLIYETIK